MKTLEEKQETMRRCWKERLPSGKAQVRTGTEAGNTQAIPGSSEFATEKNPEKRTAFSWEAIHPIYGNGSEEKFLFSGLPYDTNDLTSSQDIPRFQR